MTFVSLRTAYQGKYFEFLTSDMRKPPIQSVEELIEKEIIIFTRENFGSNLVLFNVGLFTRELDIFKGYFYDF